MNAQRHQIRRQIFDITVPDRASGLRLHDELSRLQGRGIEALIDRCCTELSAPDRVHRLGRVEVDLGELSLEGLESELIKRLYPLLREALASKIHEEEQLAVMIGEDPTSNAQIELVSLFVRTGTLPFWADVARPRVVDEAVEGLLARSPAALSSLVREITNEPRAIARLVRHVDAERLRALFESLVEAPAPRASERAAEVWELFAIARTAWPALSKTTLWVAALRAVCHGESRGRDAAALFREVLGRASIESGIKYRALVTRLYEALGPRQRRAASGIGAVLATFMGELWADQRRDSKAAPKGATGEAAEAGMGAETGMGGDAGTGTSTDRETDRETDADMAPSEQTSTRSKRASDPSKTGPDLPTRALNQPKAGPDLPSRALDPPKAGPDLPSRTSEAPPEAGPDLPARALDQPKAGPDLPSQASGPPPKAGPDLPSRASTQPKAGPDLPSRASEPPKAGRDLPTRPAEPPKAGLDLPTGGSEPPDAGREPPKQDPRPAGRAQEAASQSFTTSAPTPSKPSPRRAASPQERPRSEDTPTNDAQTLPKARATSAHEEPDAIYLDTAGLVLLWPFVATFFERIELLTEKKAFVDPAARRRAVLLLQHLATLDPEPSEYRLPLAKVLCGMPLDEVFEPGPELTEAELKESAELLAAVIQHAKNLGDITIQGLRDGFLLRRGVLSTRDGSWLLRVERAPYDIVLNQLPWPFTWVNLPWMEAPLAIEWIR